MPAPPRPSRVHNKDSTGLPTDEFAEKGVGISRSLLNGLATLSEKLQAYAESVEVTVSSDDEDDTRRADPAKTARQAEHLAVMLSRMADSLVSVQRALPMARGNKRETETVNTGKDEDIARAREAMAKRGDRKRVVQVAPEPTVTEVPASPVPDSDPTEA